jgi:glycosyltransferase involved in cell wall biosynthesis
MAVHNEEAYLPLSLESLKEAPISELVVVLDRCTDRSEAIVRKEFPEARIITKTEAKWKNSYAENLQIGFNNSSMDIMCIQDADIKSSPKVFQVLEGKLDDTIASVSPALETYKRASLLNFVYHYWEKTFELISLGREPRGGFRLIKRKALEKVGGFKDVEAPDTQLDLDLRKAGYESKFVKEVTCLHLRKVSANRAIRSQILSGRMRRKMKMPFLRVLAHSLVRLRPFVLYGYLKGQ